MMKSFSRGDMLKCIPIIWSELVKIRGRVDEVLRSLDNKTVKNEKVVEFKRQLVSNKKLKDYFVEHP
jgi:hypothetical protein